VAPDENLYEGDALRPALDQTKTIKGRQPAKAIVDRGYRGRKEVDGTEVLLPGKPKPGQSKSVSAKLRARFRRRAGSSRRLRVYSFHLKVTVWCS
jgi:IS5 family transposase